MAVFQHLDILAKVSHLWTESSERPADKPLAGMVLVGVQHFLETTGSLVEHLISLGLEPCNIFLTGKVYSTSADVYRRLKNVLGIHVFGSGSAPGWGRLDRQIELDVGRMWGAVARRLQDSGLRRVTPRAILIVDDGAFTVRQVPRAIQARYPVVGVEQTTYGTRDAVRLDGSVQVPVIDVASSAAKVLLEPPLIQQAVIARLRKAVDLDNPNLRVGVVGLGHIGRAVADYLAQGGRRLAAFDHDAYASRRSGLPAEATCGSLREAFEKSDCILGCTGDDLLEGQTWIEELSGDKLLASCSSHDIEFRTLLRRVPCDGTTTYPVRNVEVPVGRARLRILRGGTPVNFDGSLESVPAADIALTRGLILGGLLQASEWAAAPRFHSVEAIKLSTAVQRTVVNEWLRHSGRRPLYDPAMLRVFQSDTQIAAISGGTADRPVYKAAKQSKLTIA